VGAVLAWSALLMPADPNRFRVKTVALIGKRAGYVCSNPDCLAMTTGAAKNPQSSVSVGEAAHIYGANPQSARHRPEMSSAERSDVTNGIWLCGVCHKLVDDDEDRFPAGLLFEWKRAHDNLIATNVGKAGALIRERYVQRKLEELGRLTYLAEQIILEKPDAWEFKLTAELLRSGCEPVLQRWEAFKAGLYILPTEMVHTNTDAIRWVKVRLAEAQQLAKAFSALVNDEFNKAWGPVGQAGSETQIVHVCDLFAEFCRSALQWEERGRFTSLPEPFGEVHAVLNEAGGMLDEAAKVPRYMIDNFAGHIRPGAYDLKLKLDLPAGFDGRFTGAIGRLQANIAE
jgi:hypothetical protein